MPAAPTRPVTAGRRRTSAVVRRIGPVPGLAPGRGPVAALLAILALALAACVPPPVERPGPPPPTPPPVPAPAPAPPTAPQPGAAAGNPPFYEVFGERYFVLPDSAGYRERGMASWYGKDFHGKRTSSGEVYNMNDLTAAHKTLPLPSLVRVTNVANGKSVVVTVNDRGPFARNRLIDLSYAAAVQLDMIGPGTAMVEVEALAGNALPGNQVVHAPGAAATTGGGEPVAPTVIPARSLYLQVGAYRDHANALQMKQRLEANGVTNVVIRYDARSVPSLYRVRVGPISGAGEYDALAARMTTLRITDPQIVTETPAASDGG